MIVSFMRILYHEQEPESTSLNKHARIVQVFLGVLIFLWVNDLAIKTGSTMKKMVVVTDRTIISALSDDGIKFCFFASGGEFAPLLHPFVWYSVLKEITPTETVGQGKCSCKSGLTWKGVHYAD